jgi:hypothetical protein
MYRKLGVPVQVLGALLGLEHRLQPIPGLLQQPSHGLLLATKPLAYKPFANRDNDFAVHRNGEVGSPRASGDTNSSNACSIPGYASLRGTRGTPRRDHSGCLNAA